MMDILKFFASTCCSILSMICLFAGLLNDALLLGFLGFGVCIFFAIMCMSAVSSETWKMVREEEKRQEHVRMNNGYKCPNCGMHAGHNISTLNKAVSVKMLGLASDKIGKTYKCEYCNYMW